MKLQELLYKVKVIALAGDRNVLVSAVCLDSRRATASSLFVAINGSITNGEHFINDAITNGAIVIVTETAISEKVEGVVYVEVANAANAAGLISHHFYREPSANFKLVGITGTNGKTTVATLLYNLYTAMGYVCGLISTVENRVGTQKVVATHTTPDAVSLNALLSTMAGAACTHVFMECSSHAIQQHRLAGLIFTGAIFTNISHDHLDYHKTFDEYIRVKKSWFDGLPSNAFAISNADDKRGAVMLQNTKAKKYYYSLKSITNFKGKILDNSLQGLHMTVNDTDVYFKMIGEFNAYNLLSVYAAALCMGQTSEQVLIALSNVDGAEGRFDYSVSNRQKVVGIVDYAHTPDALLNVLVTIKKLRHGHEKIITVVGCGGNRDKTKRPIMAQVACEHSDKVFFTSDNPRFEDPLDILKEMEVGVGITARKKYETIADRRTAIHNAVSFSTTDDIVLIAGKGHEKYQEINGIRTAFDDKKVLAEMFELLEK